MYMCMHTPDCVCVQHNSAGPLKATKKPSHLLELELQSVVSWWPYGCQEPNSGRTKCSCFLSCPFNGSGLVFIPLLWICWFLKSRVSFFVFVFEFYQLECAFKKNLTNFSECRIHLINHNVLNVLLFTWKYFFSANDIVPFNG